MVERASRPDSWGTACLCLPELLIPLPLCSLFPSVPQAPEETLFTSTPPAKKPQVTNVTFCENLTRFKTTSHGIHLYSCQRREVPELQCLPWRGWLFHGQGLRKAPATQDFSFHRISFNQISKALLLRTICQDPETALLHKGAGVMQFIKLDFSSIKETAHLKSLFRGAMWGSGVPGKGPTGF